MESPVLLIVMFIAGCIAAAIASSKGRTPVGWFFGGFFLTWVAILIVACLSDLKQEKSQRDRMLRDNRRLREQLNQERLKGEAFRQHTQGRLDSHDQALDMDTRQVPTALPMQNSPPLLEEPDQFFDNLQQASGSQQGLPVPVAGSPPSPPEKEKVSRQWHYESKGKTIGPIPESQLVSMLRTGQLDGSTLVWTEQLGDWKAVKHIRGLEKYLVS